jgi:hypothetical protein
MKIAITTGIPPTLARASRFLSALSFLHTGIAICVDKELLFPLLDEMRSFESGPRPFGVVFGRRRYPYLLRTLEQAGDLYSQGKWRIRAEDAYLISGAVNQFASGAPGPTFGRMSSGSLDVEIGNVLDAIGGWLKSSLLSIQEYVRRGENISTSDILLGIPPLDGRIAVLDPVQRGLLRYANAENISALRDLKAVDVAISNIDELGGTRR